MKTKYAWTWVLLGLGVALLVATVSAAFADLGVPLTDYEPYVTGPVIHPSDLVKPYAPYTAYDEPYVTGPVIHESDLVKPYAPYTAYDEPYVTGPVIHESDLKK